MRCKVCKKMIDGYSLIDGKAVPCGHFQLSKSEVAKNKKILRELNKSLREAIRETIR